MYQQVQSSKSARDMHLQEEQQVEEELWPRPADLLVDTNTGTMGASTHYKRLHQPWSRNGGRLFSLALV